MVVETLAASVVAAGAPARSATSADKLDTSPGIAPAAGTVVALAVAVAVAVVTALATQEARHALVAGGSDTCPATAPKELNVMDAARLVT